MPDLNANDLDAAEKIIAGTARPMGITVEATAEHHLSSTTRGRAALARRTTTPPGTSPHHEEQHMKRSKAYRAAAEKIDADKLYTPLQAVRLAKET